jgi:hypothetical protein
MNANDFIRVVRDFMVGRHVLTSCPCRKRHHVTPKPIPPEAPPNSGKQSRHLREAFEALQDAEDTKDENAVVIARQKLEFNSVGLETYRAFYEAYARAMADWSSEVCGDCAVSLLAVTSPGCRWCLSQDAEILIKKIQEKLTEN